ncbi:serine kinase [Tolypothrix sp. VBCCA 56010]|uniref:serine kinase n=1 Tax=Tolypothrix sp. VBCCA 56010 TaxID=3137731 RepID=UPI003D7DE3A1
MFAYTAYNLRIHSEFPFPELSKSEVSQKPDVVISLRSLSQLETQTADGANKLVAFLELENSTAGRFLVESGRKIVVEPDPGIDEDLLRPFILGPAFAVLLRQRSHLVLHASSIAIDNGAVAFLGHSGWGKSTLANAFYNQGYGLLTDDVMAIKVESNPPIAFPSFPQVKLLPDAAASLGYDFERLTSIHAGVAKRNNRLDQGFSQIALPVKRIYVLENVAATHNEIQPLSPQNALIELVRHSRATDLLTTPEFVSSHLRQCANLVKNVSICRLKRKSSLAGLPKLVKLIEEDIAQTIFDEHENIQLFASA